MGLIADHPQPLGQVRPSVLFGAHPVRHRHCVLAYTTPDLASTAKWFTPPSPTLLTLLYTVVNIPLLRAGRRVITTRRSVSPFSLWRFVLATAGGMLSTVLMMPLVEPDWRR